MSFACLDTKQEEVKKEKKDDNSKSDIIGEDYIQDRVNQVLFSAPDHKRKSKEDDKKDKKDKKDDNSKSDINGEDYIQDRVNAVLFSSPGHIKAKKEEEKHNNSKLRGEDKIQRRLNRAPGNIKKSNFNERQDENMNTAGQGTQDKQRGDYIQDKVNQVLFSAPNHKRKSKEDDKKDIKDDNSKSDINKQ